MTVLEKCCQNSRMYNIIIYGRINNYSYVIYIALTIYKIINIRSEAVAYAEFVYGGGGGLP